MTTRKTSTEIPGPVTLQGRCYSLPCTEFLVSLNFREQIRDRLDPLRTGSALDLTAGTISMIYALVFFLFPDGMIGFVNAWFHGLGRERVLTHGEVLEEGDN